MSPSHSFEQFLESLHAPRTDRRYAEEFHIGALGVLRGEERERAERLLLDRLRDDLDDDRVFSALGIVGSAASIPPLREALDSAEGVARVRLAAALAVLDPTFDPVHIHLEALRQPGMSAREAAARELARCPREMVVPPLLDTLGDQFFAVRVSAYGALQRALGLIDLRKFEYGRLKSIGMRLLSDLPSVFGGAAAEMREVVAALRAGGSPGDAGLLEPVTSSADAINRVMTSLASRKSDARWSRDLDLDAFAGLDDVGRRYVESVLLSELHNNDARVPRALLALDSGKAPVALRDALDHTRGLARVQVARALEIITRDGTGRQALVEMAAGPDVDSAKEALREIEPGHTRSPSHGAET